MGSGCCSSMLSWSDFLYFQLSLDGRFFACRLRINGYSVWVGLRIQGQPSLNSTKRLMFSKQDFHVMCTHQRRLVDVARSPEKVAFYDAHKNIKPWGEKQNHQSSIRKNPTEGWKSVYPRWINVPFTRPQWAHPSQTTSPMTTKITVLWQNTQ